MHFGQRASSEPCHRSIRLYGARRLGWISRGQSINRHEYRSDPLSLPRENLTLGHSHPTTSSFAEFSQKHQDNPLSHRPRKRCGQDCCPKWFFCVFRGVKGTQTRAVDDFADIPIMAAITLARSGHTYDTGFHPLLGSGQDRELTKPVEYLVGQPWPPGQQFVANIL